MKVLVTGAKGQLGRALAARVPAGIDCLALDRGGCDLADPAAIRTALATHKPDAVINAGAYTAVDRAESEAELARAVNATAVGVLAAYGAPLVQVSTDFVFGGSQSTPYRPEDARDPLGVYGASKAAGEDGAGDDACVVRTSWVYAAGGGNFVRTMLRLMRECDEVRVVADQIGAPTWASGLADTLWALLGKGARGMFHHRDAGAASWYDFAVAIQEEALVLGLLSRAVPVIPIATADYPTPARRPAYSLLDDSGTRALLGDRPPHWRVNLRKMLHEEKSLG